MAREYVRSVVGCATATRYLSLELRLLLQKAFKGLDLMPDALWYGDQT